MSAEILRKAAALMRERAEAAPTPPWATRATTHGDPANGPTHMVVENSHGLISDHDYDRWGGTSAEHIASWHPTVALAVADLLDNEASLIESVDKYPDLHHPLNSARVDLLLTLASTYLGEDA